MTSLSHLREALRDSTEAEAEGRRDEMEKAEEGESEGTEGGMRRGGGKTKERKRGHFEESAIEATNSVMSYRVVPDGSHRPGEELIQEVIDALPVKPDRVSDVHGPVVMLSRDRQDASALDVEVTTRFKAHFDTAGVQERRISGEHGEVNGLGACHFLLEHGSGEVSSPPKRPKSEVEEEYEIKQWIDHGKGLIIEEIPTAHNVSPMPATSAELGVSSNDSNASVAMLSASKSNVDGNSAGSKDSNAVLKSVLERKGHEISLPLIHARRRVGEEDAKVVLSHDSPLVESPKHDNESQVSNAIVLPSHRAREDNQHLALAKGRHSSDSLCNWEVDPHDVAIGHRLAVGGFAEVFVGSIHGTTVAVKVLENVDEAGKQRFMREVAVLASLRHPNVVLFMGFSARPHLAILSEYMHRGSLFKVLRSGGDKPLSLRLQRMVAMSVARGMAYLHSRNPPLLHLDLKSPNVLVDNRWRVKIADFGLSRLRFHTFLSGAGGGGTPEWMAPEVLRSEEQIDERADVYSYGVILWECLTGRAPWEGMHPMQVVGAVGFQGRSLPIEFPPGTDEALANLCQRCISLNRSDRPTFYEIVSGIEKDLQPDHINMQVRLSDSGKSIGLSSSNEMTMTWSSAGKLLGVTGSSLELGLVSHSSLPHTGPSSVQTDGLENCQIRENVQKTATKVLDVGAVGDDAMGTGLRGSKFQEMKEHATITNFSPFAAADVQNMGTNSNEDILDRSESSNLKGSSRVMRFGRDETLDYTAIDDSSFEKEMRGLPEVRFAKERSTEASSCASLQSPNLENLDVGSARWVLGTGEEVHDMSELARLSDRGKDTRFTRNQENEMLLAAAMNSAHL